MLIFGRVYDPDTYWYDVGGRRMLSITISKKNTKLIISRFCQKLSNLELKKELIGITGWTCLPYCHPSMANCPAATHGISPQKLSSQANNNPDTTGPAVQPQKPGVKLLGNGVGILMDFAQIIGVRNVEYVCSLLKRLTFLECCTKGMFLYIVISVIKTCFFL